MKKNLLKKLMLLLCALVVGGGTSWAETAGYTPSEALSSTTGNVTGTAGETWSYSITFDNDGYYGYSATYGWQLGAAPKNNADRGCRSFTISTNGINGTITKIEVEAGSYSANSKINVTVGGSDFGTQNQSTYSGQGSSKSTFTGNASGEIIISATDAVRAFYLKSIIVTYTPSGGGGSDPSISLGSYSIESTEAEKDGTLTVTYNNIASVDAEVLFFESDGTTAATYDWMDAEINSTDNTKLDYAIGANTGAARTAYMKVHQKNTDVYSGLITVTQAAKSVTAPSFNLDGGSYVLGTAITITSEGNAIYYTLTTDESTPAAPTNASTEYTSPIALGSGTTKIKAIAYDTYGNASSVITRTYKSIDATSLPFSWTGTNSAGKAELAEETGVVLSLGSDFAASNYPYRLKFDGTGKYVTVYTEEKPGTVFFTAKLFNAASTGSIIKVQGSADGITFTDIQEFTIKGSANATFEFCTTNAFAATHKAVKLVMSSKDQNVAVGNITIIKPVTIGTAGYATYVTPCAIDFTGVTAYKVSEVGTSNVTLDKITEAPVNTPVVIKAAEGSYNLAVKSSAEAVTGNLLQVSNGSVTGDGSTIYALGNKTHGVGFYLVTKDQAIPVGKAYLVDAGGTVKEFLGFGDDTTTKVESVKNVENGMMFNLAGQRVNKAQKGIFIVNGKKVVR